MQTNVSNNFKINDRIIQLIKYLNLANNKFADEIGISSGRMSNIATKRNKPDSDMLTKIATRYPNVSGNWLLTGEGYMILKKFENRGSNIEAPKEAPKEAPNEDKGTSDIDSPLRYEICIQMRQKLEETTGKLQAKIDELNRAIGRLERDKEILVAKLAKYEDNSSNPKGKAV